MTCQSIVTGSGVNGNCGSLNNSASFTFDGIVTFDPGIKGNCSGYFLLVNGARYDAAYFFYPGDSSIVSVGCNNSLSSEQPYDCINGNCLPSTTFNTARKYANLAACQNGCAKDAVCSGECIPTAEIAALKQAVGNLRSRLCK